MDNSIHNIDAFKIHCKEIANLQKQKEKKWKELRKSQKQYGITYQPIQNIWTYLLTKNPKCPYCKKELNEEHISYNDTSEKIILKCSDCGYEFAGEKSARIEK